MKNYKLVIISLTILIILSGVFAANKANAVGKIVLPEDSTVTLKHRPFWSGFNNQFGLAEPKWKSLGFTKNTSINTKFNLGKFDKGTELIFFIKNGDGVIFKTGPGSRNPDNKVHARIQRVEPLVWKVSFEDLWNLGDKDFNDVQFTVVATPISKPTPPPPPPTPTPAPIVDIRANNSNGPITIPYNSSANLTWTSSNANSCYASGNWSGTKSTSGSSSTGNLTYSKSYTITCTGTGGSASDSVTVNTSSSPTPAPIVDIRANNSNGPITIPYNSSANLTWTSSNANSCYASGNWSGTKSTSGSSSTGNLTYSKSYTITCTGTGGSASDSVSINLENQEEPELSISKSVSKTHNIRVDDILTFTINYKNEFNSRVTNVELYDDYNEFYLDIYDAEDGYISSGRITWYLGTLNAKESGTKTFRVYVKDNLPSTTTTYIYNKAVIDSNETPPKESNTVSMIITEGNVDVDIKANGSNGPVTIPNNSSANLSWTSENADYCYAYGDWSNSKSTHGSQTTGNLTSNKTYTITCYNNGKSASDLVRVNIGNLGLDFLSADKKVRNVSDGTSWTDSIFADPDELISFSIKVKAEGGSSIYRNVIIRDQLPDKIMYKGNLKINNVSSYGNILSGLNIGDLYSNQEKTITFDAQIRGKEFFTSGQTYLVNTVYVSADNISSYSDTAGTTVNKQAMAGITTIITGLTDNILLDSLIIPLAIALIIVWIFKSRVINFQEWLDLRKQRYQGYCSKRLLQFKIARIKSKELWRKIK